MSGFAGTDVVVDLTFAVGKTDPVLDGSGWEVAPATDELLIEAAQVGGTDVVVSLENLYRIEKPVSDGGYLVLPHGSGYLIPADCPDELPGRGHVGGFIGARWDAAGVRGSCGERTRCACWWIRGGIAKWRRITRRASSPALAFHWRDSLGTLAYRRRFRVQFAAGLDYVGMAKIYREQARREGLLRTLEEKAADSPGLRNRSRCGAVPVAVLESR